MARHRKSNLLDIIVQAIRDCNWNVLYLGDIREHPFLLSIYNIESDRNYRIRVYAWHLTHGGGAKRPSDEYRIQITGVSRFEKSQDEKTLILGWWDPGKVFAGFDYTKHRRKLGFSPSIQIREEALRKAQIHGLATAYKGNDEIAVAFRPDFFVHYIERLEEIHGFAESNRDHSILEKIIENPEQINEELVATISSPRKVIAAEIRRKLRDSSFKSRVLAAYDFACAFCDIQLKLVEAAHIVPASYSTSSDETCNGISLCSLHHRAFDKALITLNEEYRIIQNDKELTKLRNIRHDGEMERFLRDLRPAIRVPRSISDRPNKSHIQNANRIRGWFS